MTAQIRDFISVYGYNIVVWDGTCLPIDESKIIDVEDADEIFYSTACWKGYVAIWDIIGDDIYLASVLGRKRLISNSPIKAKWLTGDIKLRSVNQTVIRVEQGRIQSKAPC